jgi:hypothetical protein
MESAVNQISLRCRRPDNVTRPITMAETRTIEHDDAIILSGQIDQTARFEILDHAAITVQQDQRGARATFDIVKPDAIYFQELTSGGIVVFSTLG